MKFVFRRLMIEDQRSTPKEILGYFSLRVQRWRSHFRSLFLKRNQETFFHLYFHSEPKGKSIKTNKTFEKSSDTIYNDEDVLNTNQRKLYYSVSI